MTELSEISDRDLHREQRRRRKLHKKRSRKAHGLPAKKSGSYFRKDHEYLDGASAHFHRRVEIYRNAGGEISVVDGFVIEDLKTGMCQGCAETHEVGWAEGEWHHNVKTLGGKRCDCATCALWVCPEWHKRYHNRVIRSGKVGA